MSKGIPVTAELRMATRAETDADTGMELLVVPTIRMSELCDAIDALHESLEAENDALRAQVRALKAELADKGEPQTRDEYLRGVLEACAALLDGQMVDADGMAGMLRDVAEAM